MKKIEKSIINFKHKYGISLFTLLLVSFLFFSLIPVFIIISNSINNLDYSKQVSQSTIKNMFREQGIKTFKENARNLSDRISDFLKMCVNDLDELSILPKTNSTYLAFNNRHKRYNDNFKDEIFLYKELVLIDKNGNEKIKIKNGQLNKVEQLKNISNPINTTYKTEQYFEKTKQSFGDYYVTHLKNWYISRNEQLEGKKSFEGVIRFCKKIKNLNEDFNGILMLALDFNHILQFINFENVTKDKLVERYIKSNYKYIIDDEGWIIAHQKLWDIRGFDKSGKLVKSLDENTPEWKFESGIIPINLMNMDWRLKDINSGMPISNLVERVRRGETVFATMKSMGIKGYSQGIIRSRVYAPIYFNVPPYDKYSIFGAVSIGTSQKDFINKFESFSKELDQINYYSIREMVIITLLLSIILIFFSYIIARSMSRSLKKINFSLSEIGKERYKIPVTESKISEMQNLLSGVKLLANRLKTKDEKLLYNMKSLEFLNIKLVKAEKELAKYLKKEYSNEPHNILEDRMSRLQIDFPKLKKYRETICIGNNAKFLRVLRQVVAQSQMTLPTWLNGESGVGKTAIAKVIHQLSPRADKPYFVFNAAEFAAADPIIVLGKLFGYGKEHGIIGIEKDGRKGIIEECSGGTLFIDDVDALPMNTQAQLLRAIDGMAFHTAIGKSREILADVRFLFASHLDLEKLVEQNLFRKDLFRRIGGNYNKIEIPPLRERRNDIPDLVNHFIRLFNIKTKSNFSISKPAMKLLCQHNYEEGNIGELKVLIQFACENAKIEHSETITESHMNINNEVFNQTDEGTEFIEKLTNLLSSSERKELAILKGNNFFMAKSEKELGYNHGSKTLSHHFRGICLKLLVNFNEDIEKTVQAITDTSDTEINTKIEIKIKNYRKNIQDKIITGKISSLYKNLPKSYHKYLKALINKN